jgi:hypothetical protein
MLLKRSSVLFTAILAASLLIGIQAVEVVDANPYGYTFPTRTSAPDSVYITVRVASPRENATFTNGTINARFNTTIDGPDSIYKTLGIIAFYQGDWMEESKWSPFPPGVDFTDTMLFLQYDFNLSGIPIGQHTLNITAGGNGELNENNTHYVFYLQKTISVKFFVSTSPVKLPEPIVMFSSVQNTTFKTSSFSLNFTVDQPVTKMAYSIDGQEPVAISENTTLTNLSDGQHNVTVYTTDRFSNNYTSGTLFFNVNAQESFPDVPVLVASVIAIVLVSASLLTYFRRRKGKP